VHTVPGKVLGWVCSSPRGEVVDGQPQIKQICSGRAAFKYYPGLAAGAVWRMRVEGGKRGASFGFTDEGENRAMVKLSDGSSQISASLSLDGQGHRGCFLRPYFPEQVPFDLALRVDPDGNVPQVEINEDGWHDWFPPSPPVGSPATVLGWEQVRGEWRRKPIPVNAGETRPIALKAGPWFPCMVLNAAFDMSRATDARLVDHRIELQRRPAKSAGKTSALTEVED
jgi:hypothetical protein